MPDVRGVSPEAGRESKVITICEKKGSEMRVKKAKELGTHRRTRSLYKIVSWLLGVYKEATCQIWSRPAENCGRE